MISQKIIDYAIWYYLRYYPSRKKLAQKLEEKFGPTSENGKKYGGIGEKEIHFILEEKLRNIIQEGEVVKSKVKNLQKKGKNINYIKRNLLQKHFEKKDIEQVLEEEFGFSEHSILEENIISKKIESYKNKGKSKNFIRQKFIERRVDKEIIERILKEVFGEDDELENLSREFEKLGGKELLNEQKKNSGAQIQNHKKQKIIEKLLRKGFLYDDVKKIIF